MSFLFIFLPFGLGRGHKVGDLRESCGVGVAQDALWSTRGCDYQPPMSAPWHGIKTNKTFKETQHRNTLDGFFFFFFSFF